MNNAVLTILGFVVSIKYTVMDIEIIEWSLDPSVHVNDQLLETLLRIHYNEYIESLLRSDWIRKEYEESQYLPHLDDENPF